MIIIGILAAIAIPTFLAQMERAQDAELQSDLRNLAAAATSCVNDATAGVQNDYTDCDDATVLNGYGWNKSASTGAPDFTGTDTDTLVVSMSHNRLWQQRQLQQRRRYSYRPGVT